MRWLLALLVVVPACVGAAAPTESPYSDRNVLVVQARLKALARTDNPLTVYREGVMEISTSCGYDTAVVSVRKVISGHYDDAEIAANLTLGEFCASFLQPSVPDYLLFLDWNGSTWQIREELSSRLLADGEHRLWIVDPEALSALSALGAPAAGPVRFFDSRLADIAIENFERMGWGFEPGTSDEARIAELRSMTADAERGWSRNPLHFNRGVPLDAFEAWLAATYPPVAPSR
jgi:hypothetical protein